MHYIFVVYIYNLNARLVCAMPSKNNAAMITAFTKILATLTARGYKPTLNVTDNKCSKRVEAYIKSNKMDIHLVPPHNHQVNAAESAIATFKEHFIVGLATVDRNCPYNCGMNFCTKLSSPSIFSISHATILANLPTRRSMAHMTFQQNSNQANWYKKTGLQQPRSPRQLSTTQNRCILHWPRPQALLMSAILYANHPTMLHCRHMAPIPKPLHDSNYFNR
jgi:hypothetical protein